MRTLRQQLTAHVGGAPTPIQRLLIDRAVGLALRIALLDRRQADGTIGDNDDRAYLGLSNALQRTLREIGFQPTRPSLAQHLAATYPKQAAA